MVTPGAWAVDARSVAPARRDLPDLAARATIVSLVTFLAVRLLVDFLETGRLTGLLLLTSEALVVVLTVFRRPPSDVDRSLRARVLTAISLVCPPLVYPADVAALAPEAATVAVSAAGLLIVIGGKLSLGRSFGLIPANRGIVRSGLYRVVRHPIYAGYLVTHVAYLAANPSVWNLAVLVTGALALTARAVCEEATLSRDAGYRDYLSRVRWRMAPGVF